MPNARKTRHIAARSACDTFGIENFLRFLENVMQRKLLLEYPAANCGFLPQMRSNTSKNYLPMQDKTNSAICSRSDATGSSPHAGSVRLII